MTNNSDILQPLAVGNYWEYEQYFDDELLETTMVTVSESELKKYSDEDVTMYTLVTTNSTNDNISYMYKFVYGNYTFFANDWNETDILDASRCLPYKYNGETTISTDQLTFDVTEDKYNYHGKEVNALKLNINDSNYPTYYQLGVGLLMEQLPGKKKGSEKLGTIYGKLKDYHIE